MEFQLAPAGGTTDTERAHACTYAVLTRRFKARYDNCWKVCSLQETQTRVSHSKLYLNTLRNDVNI